MCDPVTIYLTLPLRKPTAHFGVVPSEVTGLSPGHGQSLEVFRNTSLREAFRTRNPFFEIPRVAENLYLLEDVLMFLQEPKVAQNLVNTSGDLRATAVWVTMGRDDKGLRRSLSCSRPGPERLPTLE